MKRILPLTDTVIRNVKNGDPRRRLSDGKGLYLLLFVKGGSHGWRFDYTFQGVSKTLSLGTYPTITLKMAREKAEEFRRLVATGIDPSDVRKAQKADWQRSRVEALAVKADAARYAFLIELFGVTKLPVLLEQKLQRGYIADGKDAIDTAIDCAIAQAAGADVAMDSSSDAGRPRNLTQLVPNKPLSVLAEELNRARQLVADCPALTLEQRHEINKPILEVQLFIDVAAQMAATRAGLDAVGASNA